MISFVVPAHNEEHELPETLRMIERACLAAAARWEIVVVDDASEDRTAAIAAAAGARVVSVQRRQIAAARNAGARAARGEILFFVDADTRIAPEHVALALRALGEGAVGGSARLEMDSALPLWAQLFLRVFSFFYFRARLGIGAFLFVRREQFEAVGGFDEQYFAGEEVYLSQALKARGRFVILSPPIVTSARKIRMHGAFGVLGQTIRIVLRGERSLLTRERLALWYDGKREGAPAG